MTMLVASSDKPRFDFLLYRVEWLRGFRIASNHGRAAYLRLKPQASTTEGWGTLRGDLNLVVDGR
jgi:hypothetical protein